MATPYLDDGTDKVEIFFDGEYSGPVPEVNRPTLEVPKKEGNPQQNLGTDNTLISGTVNLTGDVEINGSPAGSPETVAEQLLKWHKNSTELTFQDEQGKTYTVTLLVRSRKKTRNPDVWQTMSIELEEVN